MRAILADEGEGVGADMDLEVAPGYVPPNPLEEDGCDYERLLVDGAGEEDGDEADVDEALSTGGSDDEDDEPADED